VQLKNALLAPGCNTLRRAGVFSLIAMAAQSAQSAPPPSMALDAYRAIDGWVRSAHIPDEAPDLELDGVTAIGVTLRSGGRVIGRGSVVAGVAPPAMALREAAGLAWTEAAQRFMGENDALRRQRLVDGAQAVTIDIELAGAWTPIGGDTFARAGEEIISGVEGVGARVGDRLIAVMPGTMRSANGTPAQGLLSAVGALDLPPVRLHCLRDEHELVVYRFPVTRLAQTNPASEPVFLFRGGRLTPASDVTTRGIRRFADRLARNITARDWPGEEPFGLMDTLRPWVGDYAEPVIAPARAQALAALALTKWTSLDPDSEARRAIVAALLSELAHVSEEEDDPAGEISSASMTLLAINEAQRARVWGDSALPGAIETLRTRCRKSVARGIDGAESIESPMLALVACAAASDERIDPSAVEQVVRSLFRDAPPQELPALSPWIGWAELSLRERDEPIPASIALREHRSMLWRHQVQSVGVGAQQPDLVGGIVFTAARHPAPSWQTARAMALVATMLGDERLTRPDERLPEIARLTRSIRFLMELAIDETEAALFPATAENAVGAVRASLTDQRAPLDATSMTLITVCEAIESLRRIETQR